MPRTLVICAVAGLALSAGAFGLAVTLGGDGIFHDANSMRAVKPLIDMATRKEWRWSGGDTLAMDAPINVRYDRAGPPQVSITGPAEVMRHVKVSEGRIATDTNVSRRNGSKVEAVVSGMAIRKFVVNGGESLDLGTLKQPDLDLHINGNGKVRGSGEVARLNLVIAGAGTAGLGALTVTDAAKVSILGNGTVSLAPKGDVRLFIAGNGTLAMATKPRSLSRTILGNGEVRDATREESASPLPPPPHPPEVASQDMPMPMPLPVPVPLELPSRDGNSLSILDHRSIDFGHVEQPDLKVNVMASGTATAEGKVDHLKVAVMGSGRANLGALHAIDAEVAIGGSGTATVAVTGRLKVTIMGSGNVRLMTRPERIDQTILGSGKIIPYDK